MVDLFYSDAPCPVLIFCRPWQQTTACTATAAVHNGWCFSTGTHTSKTCSNPQPPSVHSSTASAPLNRGRQQYPGSPTGATTLGLPPPGLPRAEQPCTGGVCWGGGFGAQRQWISGGAKCDESGGACVRCGGPWGGGGGGVWATERVHCPPWHGECQCHCVTVSLCHCITVSLCHCMPMVGVTVGEKPVACTNAQSPLVALNTHYYCSLQITSLHTTVTTLTTALSLAGGSCGKAQGPNNCRSRPGP